MTSKKIGWQKYEDIIERQINSPIISMISDSVANHMPPMDTPDEFALEYDRELAVDQHQPFISIPEDISTEIQLTSSFDCWMAHANFDITDNIMKQLDKVRGVEVLKVCSRYRFFLGVGRMFDFSDVRKEIEDTLL